MLLGASEQSAKDSPKHMGQFGKLSYRLSVAIAILNSQQLYLQERDLHKTINVPSWKGLQDYTHLQGHIGRG